MLPPPRTSLAALTAAALLLWGCGAGGGPDAGGPDSGAPDAGPPPIVNPVLKSDFPDPHVVRVGSVFHGWATNVSRGGVRWNIPHVVSTNLAAWIFRDDALPNVGTWADGYAERASALGPCTKKTGAGPWLQSAFGLAGPGGQDFFTDEAGQTWMSLHGWIAPDVGYPAGKRALWLYRFGIESGVPKLSAP